MHLITTLHIYVHIYKCNAFTTLILQYLNIIRIVQIIAHVDKISKVIAHREMTF